MLQERKYITFESDGLNLEGTLYLLGSEYERRKREHGAHLFPQLLGITRCVAS